MTSVSELHSCYLQHILDFSDNFGILPKQRLEINVMETGILGQVRPNLNFSIFSMYASGNQICYSYSKPCPIQPTRF